MPSSDAPPPLQPDGGIKPAPFVALTAGAVPPVHAASQTIDRSAAPQAKGPRLQRLRACLFLLDAVKDDANVQAYAAVEVEGDAVIKTATASNTSTYSEENKNYDEARSFTFVSTPVLNTMVLFADAWIDWKYSESVKLGFYSTRPIGGEIKFGRVVTLGLTLPKLPILECLQKNDFSDPCLLSCVKALVLAEYAAQYKDKKIAGHLSVLTGWDDNTWLKFLSMITWLFSQDDEDKTEEAVTEAVKRSPFFTPDLEGKEQLIVAALLQEFDKKQSASDFAHRFVHGSDVRLIFQLARTNEIRLDDPTWKQWESLPKPVDNRNLREKLQSVCPALSKRALQKFQRRTGASLIEFEQLSQNKNILAMRFQIYDACEEAIALLEPTSSRLTEAEIEREIERLVGIAVARVQERAKQHHYPVTDAIFIGGLVLALLDSCYLTFD